MWEPRNWFARHCEVRDGQETDHWKQKMDLLYLWSHLVLSLSQSLKMQRMGMHHTKVTRKAAPGSITLHIEDRVLLKGCFPWWSFFMEACCKQYWKGVESTEKIGLEYQDFFFFRQMQQSILGYAGFSLAPTHSCPLSLTLSPSTGQLGTQKNNQVWIPDFLLLCSFSVPESCHLLKNFPTKKSSWLVSVIKRVLADISPVVP